MYLVKKNLVARCYLFTLFLITSCIQLQALADWTVLTYLQADNNLAPFAEFNILEMQAAKPSNTMNILVQWHQPNNEIAERYHVTSTEVKKDETVVKPNPLRPDQDLVNAMQWAVKNYPARHYMLVLWNHGNGILDQSWYHRGFRSALMHPINYKPWLEIPGLPIISPRGILYSETTNSYMNNQQLAQALQTIKKEVIGKKIDIVGMDACLMAMLEVGYQIKDYANILVASQNSEPGRGWDYRRILRRTASKTSLSPAYFAKQIVFTFANYYKKQLAFYTQSAIDLKQLDAITDNLNVVIKKLHKCKKLFAKKTNYFINLAHSLSVKFDTPSYIDLHSFYKGLIKVTQPKKEKKSKRYQPPKPQDDYSKALASLQQTVTNGLALIENAIIANVAGPYVKRAQGISIYFPKEKIHESYLKTKFAEETQWLSFLAESKKS